MRRPARRRRASGRSSARPRTRSCARAQPVRRRARSRSARSPSSRDQCVGERLGVAGRDEHPGLAVDDDLRDRAHARRDDGQRRRASPRAARCPNPSQREVCANTSARASQSRGSTRPGIEHRVGEPELAARAPSSAPRAVPSRGSRAAPRDARRARVRTHRSSVAWSFCSIRRPIASTSGARRDAGARQASARTAPRAARRARSGSSSQLRRRQAGADVERAHGLRDRDRSRRTPLHQRAVDVAKRPEQVAVVVVARRDERHAQRVRGERPVDVARGPCACARGRGRSLRTVRVTAAASRGETSRPHGTRVHGTPRSSSASWNRSASPPASSERKRASTPRSRSAGSSVEQVLLGAADPCTLVRCRTFTAPRMPA